MIKLYEKYLEIIGSKFDKFFEQQKPYIFCKEGCSMCCESGTYPLCELEFKYMMLGYEALSDEFKKQIKKNIIDIKSKKKELEGGKLLYECPFLINKKCSIYEHRALICRSYGLIAIYYNENGEERYKLPYCIDQGLNYSNVYDKDFNKISLKKWEQTGIEVEPEAHNVDLAFLLDNEITQDLNLKFGPVKGLIDWFN